MKLIVITFFLLTYHFGITQVYTEIDKVVGSYRAEDNRFGQAVAITDNFAMVGTYGYDDNGPNRGAIFVYEKQGLNWVETQLLINSDDENYDRFGWSVAIDGNYMIVGAIGEDDDLNGSNSMSKAGAAYIFENQAGTWTEIQKIIASDRSIDDEFGWSVDIDDNTIIVGAHQDFEDVNGLNPIHHAGSSYIFEKNIAGVWTETQKIVGSGRAPDLHYPNGHVGEDLSDQFGHSVGVSGNYIIVGALNHDWNPTNTIPTWQTGAAYIFEKTGTVWTEVQKIRNSDNITSGGWERFGSDVAIDSNIIAIGVWSQDYSVTGTDYMKNAGAIYTFIRNVGGTWTENQKITAGSRNSGDHFGWDVKINDGFIISGVEHDDHDENETNALIEAGSTYIFEKDASNQFIQISKINASDRDSLDVFGYAVDIYGTEVIVGAFQHDFNTMHADSINEAGAAYIFSSDPCPTQYYDRSIEICFGDSYMVGSSTYSVNGVYTDVLTSLLYGCDSSITTNLTVMDEIINNQNITICYDENLLVGTSTYTLQGNYNDTIVSLISGCDSIVNTNLTVIQPVITNQDITICYDENILVGTSTYTIQGAYVDTINSIITGCDSVINTNLTVIQPVITNQNITICYDENILVGTSTYTIQGTYVDTINSIITGCDSVINTNLTVIQPVIINQNITICYDENLLVGTSTYTIQGAYVDTINSIITGCDSVINTNLTVIQPVITNQNITICYDENLLVGTSTYTIQGTYADTINSIITGCDSIINTNLTVVQPVNTNQNITICYDENLLVGTSIYTNQGVYIDTINSIITGCDSIIHTDLTVIQPVNTNQNITICYDENLLVGTSLYTIQGTYIDTINSIITGCDSIIHTDLTVIQPVITNQSITICYDENLIVGTSTYTIQGTYADTINSIITGCDSVINTNLTVIQPVTVYQTITICDGDDYSIGTSIYTIAGNYSDTLTATITGCDSIVETEINIITEIVISQNITICYGESYTIGNNSYDTPGNYTDTLLMITGSCDSIVHTNLSINLPINLSLDINNNNIESNQNNSFYQWVDCNDSYSFITNTISNEQDIEVVATGNYAVIINNNNCIDTSACVLVNYVGLDESNANYLVTIYPNPSNGQFTISSNASNDFTVRVHNSIGQSVYSVNAPSTNQTINISFLPNGMYFIEMNFENKIVIKKYVLN